MTFRKLIIFIIFLDIVSRSIGGLVVLLTDNQLPIIIQLFNLAIVLYGVWLFVYTKIRSFSLAPFLAFFVLEIVIFITNLFAIHFLLDTWYTIHLNVFQFMVTGNFLDVAINVIILVFLYRAEKNTGL